MQCFRFFCDASSDDKLELLQKKGIKVKVLTLRLWLVFAFAVSIFTLNGCAVQVDKFDVSYLTRNEEQKTDSLAVHTVPEQELVIIIDSTQSWLCPCQGMCRNIECGGLPPGDNEVDIAKEEGKRLDSYFIKLVLNFGPTIATLLERQLNSRVGKVKVFVDEKAENPEASIIIKPTLNITYGGPIKKAHVNLTATGRIGEPLTGIGESEKSIALHLLWMLPTAALTAGVLTPAVLAGTGSIHDRALLQAIGDATSAAAEDLAEQIAIRHEVTEGFTKI